MKQILQTRVDFVKSCTLWIISALLLLILFSCTDYSKDINDLQNQVSELQKSINDLKEAQQSGKVISNVVATEDANGYNVVFSDGTSITLNHGNSGADGEDGNHGTDGVTPIIKIDSEGYWIVSYDDEATFTRILDGNSNPIPAVSNGKDGVDGIDGEDGLPGADGTDGADGLPGADGKCVRVTTDADGYYVFEIYSPSSPDEILEKIVTPFSSDPKLSIAAIVKNEENGTITLTMGDGAEFQFNLDVAYPTSLVVLDDAVHVDALKDGVLLFRLNPSDAYVSFILEGENRTLELDVVSSSSRSGESVSYVNPAKGYKITEVTPDVTEDGSIKQGQYKAKIASLNNGENPSEKVCLVLTTKNARGETIRISSNPFPIINGEGTEIMSLTINGVEAEKTGNVFHVKLPPTTNLKSLKPEFVGNCTSITVKGGEASRTVSESYDFSTPVTLVATGPDGSTVEYTVVITFSNLPVMYVTTPSPIVSKDDWVKNCAIQIANSPDYASSYENVQMKGRGNSTWGYPKKPYAIKLDKKAEVLGMPKHKRWVLLANWMDRTNIRNAVTFEIGRRMSGLAWTPRGHFVDLVLNGQYQGNYYLCEQIKVDSNRVSIDEMEATDINEPEITGGYLLEFDTHFDEVNKFKTTVLNLPINIKEPDEDVMGLIQLNYIKGYINNIEQSLADRISYSEIESLLNIDSFIDWWLVHELVLNYEPGNPNSCYIYKERSGKLFAGPLWDFDWATYTANTRWIDKESLWYVFLFTYPEFVKKVEERWSLCRTNLETIPNYIESLAKTIGESATYDCQMWPIYPVYNGRFVNGDEQLSYLESIDRLKAMYIQRFNWIDENIGELSVEIEDQEVKK